MNPRQKAINKAIKSFGGTSHPGKKAAPGIHYKELTPKEKYYRSKHDSGVHRRQKAFESSGYGRHLTERERNRGEVE